MVLKAVELTYYRVFLNSFSMKFSFLFPICTQVLLQRQIEKQEGFSVMKLASIFSKFQSNEMTLNFMDFLKMEKRNRWESPDNWKIYVYIQRREFLLDKFKEPDSYKKKKWNFVTGEMWYDKYDSDDLLDLSDDEDTSSFYES